MGCSNSKVDDLPAVSLCRDRLTFLDQAIHYRYDLARSHIAYIHSLKSVGRSLHNFIHQQDPSHLSSSSPIPGSPKKPDPDPKHAHHHHQAHALNHDSHSGHLDFHSDSDDDGGSDLSLHDDDLHSGLSTPNLHHIDYPDPGQDPDPGYGHGGGGGGGGGFFMNYMKNKATPPSVVYEQRPPNPETVYMGESSNSGYGFSYYGNSYGNSSASPYSNYGYGYPNSNPNPNFNNSNGYYANSPNYGGGGGGAAVEGSTSNPKPPPPPPSPPQVSTWDFLNPFESYDKYYSASSPAVAYTPSRDSKVREEEGIPALEDVDSYYHRGEVVKEVHGDQKFVRGGDHGGRGSHSKAVVVEDDDDDDDEVDGVHDHEASTSLYEARPRKSSGGVENDRAEFDVHVIEKKVVGNEDEEGRSRYKGLNVFQVASEIQALFERASEFGNEVAKLLEVGKLPYNRKNSVFQGTNFLFVCLFLSFVLFRLLDL